MKPLTADDPETKSADILAGNIDHLKAIFPEAFTEGKVDFEVLKQLLGGAVEERDEKYGLNWHGKRRARQLALTPSNGTLRPCPEESVDWDTTQNLMIEGDNLEVLKLLQKSYGGKVKLIYIDPPYNTGKDFVYPDDFKDSIRNYLEITGQIGEGGGRTSSNSEASGRFHTKWLNMMYPRLRLARSLLRNDGALFISIDDGELGNLKSTCSEIFGEENFVGVLSVLVNPRGRHLDRFIAKTHDCVLVFVKDANERASIVGMSKEGSMLDEYDRTDENGKYRELGLRNRNQAFNPATRPNLFFPLFVDSVTGRVATNKQKTFSIEVLPVAPDGTQTCWTWSRDKVESENHLLIGRAIEDGSWRIFRKDYLLDADGESASTLAKSLWIDKEFNNDYGRKSLKELFGSALLDFPKSPHLLERIVSMGSGPEDIVVDFFAGSGTTGHAVLQLNSSEQSSRRFVLVQLPESTRRKKESGDWDESAAFKSGFATIADVTKERLRRTAKKVRADNPMFAGDLGFRVFKLASSNIRAWEPDRDDLPATLEESVEHLKSDRTEADILYELLLKLGLDLCVPIETKTIAGKSVHSVGAGTLLVCLAEKIASTEAEPLALGIVEWHKALAPAGDTTCVFRDSAFADDVAKTNVAAILHQHGLLNVRSL